jgi:drug/metabolite transporter (DMT)-like permease
VKTIVVIQSEQKIPNLALTALIAGAVAISFSAIFVRLSLVGPITTAFWRMALAFPAFWLWMQLERRPGAGNDKPAPRPLTATDYRWLIAAGLFFAGDLITWHLAIKFTTVANSVLLANFAPIYVTIGGWLLFGQRVNFTFVVGMLLAIAGAAMLVGASFSLSTQHLLGDLLALTTAIFYGGYILSIKRLRDGLSTGTTMAWAAAITAAVLLPVALITEPTFFPVTLVGWLVLLGLALISHTGGQGLVTFALAHLPASFSSVTLLLQPVLAAIFAWLLLGEVLNPRQIIGGGVVLVGIFIARRASRLS